MILLTGGSGRLGTELRNLRTDLICPAHKEVDITDCGSIDRFVEGKEFDLIVNLAAYTDVDKAEIERNECFRINVLGAINLKSLKKPILHISTEYVFDGAKGNYKETDKPNPLGYYAKTKLMAEEHLTRHKIVRLLFKPRPWPYDEAYDNQFTSGDYTDVIAKELSLAIDLFGKLPNIIHIGTGRKSMYELALKTKKDVKTNKLTDKKRPLDTSLDCSVWERIKNDSSIETELRSKHIRRIK